MRRMRRHVLRSTARKRHRAMRVRAVTPLSSCLYRAVACRSAGAAGRHVDDGHAGTSVQEVARRANRFALALFCSRHVRLPCIMCTHASDPRVADPGTPTRISRLPLRTKWTRAAERAPFDPRSHTLQIQGAQESLGAYAEEMQSHG